MKKLFFILTILFMTHTAEAKMITKEIPYKHGDVELTGYLVYDDSIKTPAPGVLLIPEWWGHNDYVRKRAEQVAAFGYVAFALDMYGTGKLVDTPDAAGKLATPFYEDRSLMRGRAQAGLDVLKAQPQVDATKLAVMGYCFGGTTALELARGGADVLGTVSFHGGLSTPTPAKDGVIKGRVLALNGADDPMVKPEEVAGFKAEMTAAHVNFKSIDYPGALHAFTNPAATEKGLKFNIPVAYNEAADQKSWEELKTFLQEIFK